MFGPYLDIHKEGGVAPDSTNMDKGREGIKNPKIFADVLNGSPLYVFCNGFNFR